MITVQYFIRFPPGSQSGINSVAFETGTGLNGISYKWYVFQKHIVGYYLFCV